MNESPSILPIRPYNLSWLQENLNDIPTTNTYNNNDRRWMQTILNSLLGSQESMSSDGHQVFRKGWGSSYNTEVRQIFVYAESHILSKRDIQNSIFSISFTEWMMYGGHVRSGSITNLKEYAQKCIGITNLYCSEDQVDKDLMAAMIYNGINYTK